MIKIQVNSGQFYILVSIILGVCGQLLFKKGALHLGQVEFHSQHSLSIVIRMLTSPPLLLGIVCYACSTFSWIIALSKVDLSYAYPMLSIGYVLVFFLSWLLFKEAVTPIRLLGTGVVCVGVYLIAIS